MQQFNASVIISEQLNRLMVNAAQELAQRAVSACAEHYKFDAEEAIGLLGLNNVKLERKGAVKEDDGEKAEKKVDVPKPKFPLPYNGEFNDSYCYALRQNNGLYTQCFGVRGNAQFCKSCAKQMQKTSSDNPEYGTIQQRQAVDIFEYVDPNGRKPVAYTKLMKKYKLTQEQVLEEAGKFNITINDNHFIAPEESRKGRPKGDKKDEKQKGLKGRPKKEKRVLKLDGDSDDEDLFAALVEEANAQGNQDDESSRDSHDSSQALSSPPTKEEEVVVSEEEKEQERIEREAKKKAEEEQKAAKKGKKETKSTDEEEEDEEEPEEDRVKKFTYENKKYLKSVNTGIVYDYEKYINCGDQVKIGVWNNTTEKIDLCDDEESEEEYDE